MNRTETLLLMAAEGIVGACFLAASWLAPNVGPGAHFLVSGVVLAFLFFAWASTWSFKQP